MFAQSLRERYSIEEFGFVACCILLRLPQQKRATVRRLHLGLVFDSDQYFYQRALYLQAVVPFVVRCVERQQVFAQPQVGWFLYGAHSQ